MERWAGLAQDVGGAGQEGGWVGLAQECGRGYSARWEGGWGWIGRWKEGHKKVGGASTGRWAGLTLKGVGVGGASTGWGGSVICTVKVLFMHHKFLFQDDAQLEIDSC